MQRVIEDLQTAFVDTQRGWYLAPEVDDSGIVHSDIVDDLGWNYATGRALSAKGVDGCMNALAEHGRSAGFYVTPDDAPYVAAIEASGCVALEREAVMTMKSLPDHTNPDLDIRLVDADKDAEVMVDVFARCSSGGEDEPYGALDVAPYVTGLRRSMMRRDTWHFIGSAGDEVVSIGSVAISGHRAGLYNGAVLPEFRRRGFGMAMLAHRCRFAVDNGAAQVFFQTVEDDSVHRRCSQNGFETAFVATIFGLPA